MNVRARCTRAVLCVVVGLSIAPGAMAYSVLTHEAIIDAAWKQDISPLLLKRFPKSTPEELIAAQAYAYGGAIIQDMGYYPFGSKFFSDLAHYVRAGDFILNLIDESTDLNEYAFALGALAHYAADNFGHPAINQTVPIMFPKLQKKFGRMITYGDDPAAHLKVEFSFDVTQVAEGHYAPAAYHNFIGFEVSKPVFERAFARTYSLEASKVFRSEDLAISTYRYTISSILPMMTKAAWSLKHNEIQKAQPSATRKKFIYNMSRADYQKKWGKVYEKPGVGARMIAFAFRILPKVGPLRALAFKPAPAASETLFMKGFNDVLVQYRRLLAEHKGGKLRLPDDNFDTGEPIKPGAYRLVDTTYAKLMDKLSGKPISPELRANILSFYSNLDAPFADKSDAKSWQKILSELNLLKADQPAGGLATGKALVTP
jgi:hypothetical protein